MMIREQQKLVNEINLFTIKNLPHSILLLGEQGSCHDDICKYIADKFDLWPCDITEFINLDYISEIQSSSIPSLYFVDMSKITEREQNILLKLYEEPNKLVYIVLNCTSEDIIIDTIKNRSYVLKISVYKKEYLEKSIIDKDNLELILSICTTPGQVEVANRTNINLLKELCTNIINSIGSANYQNALSISNKINFTDEYDKFDLNIFIKMLKHEMLLSSFNNKQIIYNDFNKMSKYISSMNNKQQFFENFLTKMWKYSQC